ncbi:hypothetical protein BUALT_Bualt05G0007700 [Buddleja alternifolia]|uniref:Uncharacterized protein n=1 Tax=Buddleja alternifolia TaxID=168488 RepID=A0AAV6XRD0_9LAMI|nr:hypothetical protein BUALT_Bualt05G0007700 [Buddleja alternifolia]
MGLKVQLRDPLRNYEMVGSSMLALIHVDKKTLKAEEDHLDENTKDFEQKQEKIYESQFKISRVHLAGLNSDKQLWGSSRQRQSGLRWLLSNGMAKSNQNIVSTNSNAVIKCCSGLMRNAWSEDVLWSISSPVESEAATWDDQIALNVHVRNPDIIFPFEAVK